MILDHLDNAQRYAGLHPLFATAFAWAKDPANRATAPGRSRDSRRSGRSHRAPSPLWPDAARL